jgi:hypothetical protein
VLNGDNGHVEENNGMLKIYVDYYMILFSREDKLDIDLNDDFGENYDLVTDEHNAMLNIEFSKQEIKDSIFGSYAEGAPAQMVFISLLSTFLGAY